MQISARKQWSIALLAVVTTLTVTATSRGQGMFLPGISAVNRSMGGAATAAPIEAIGALHWNPGSISALPTSEVSFGLELLLADVDTTILGTTSSGEAGVVPIPAVGWVHHMEGTNMTVGLGVYAIAGFRNNQPAGPTFAQIGIGSQVFADAEYLQLAPTVSWALTDRLSFGIAPTITTGKVQLNPLIAPAGSVPFPGTPASGNRVHWGGGVQAGLYYMADNCWNFGFTFKSPQWFEKFRFFTPGGVETFELDLPMILSAGVSYSGFENWIFALDVRYFDYKNADGFNDLGWNSVLAASFGVQYRMSEKIYLRAGYAWNESPIKGAAVAANFQDPLIQEHQISIGSSYRFAENVDLSLSYIYLLDHSETTAVPLPVTSTINAHSLGLAVTVRY